MKNETKLEINLDGIYAPSENIVAREIEGELIIIPIVSGIGDLEDELFTLNEMGKAIWNKLDGKHSVKEMISYFENEYEPSSGQIQKDVIGFMGELLKRKMILEITGK